TNELALSSRSIQVQMGPFDLPVEIWRSNNLITGYLSTLQVGDCFHKLENDQWFKLVGPVKITPPVRGWSQHPSFMMPGLEVLQASPIQEQVPRLLNCYSKSDYYDAIDVEVTEIKQLK